MNLLLAVHSYPGANEAVSRHWPFYEKSGAKKILGIGTTDGKCKWPEGADFVNIGVNSYINGDILPQRMIDTMRLMLLLPYDRFCLIEWDCLFFKPLPEFSGMASWLTGGRHNGMKAEHFFHCPWAFDFETGTKVVQAGQQLLIDGEVKPGMPECSPDVFFGWACERAGIKVNKAWDEFTRNALDLPGDLQRAREAHEAGVHCIHGIKHAHEVNYIT